MDNEIKYVNKLRDIINRQKVEIEELQAKKLSKEQDRDYWMVQTRMARGKVKNAKSEAIKEFAEKVKTECYREFDELIPSLFADIIDNIVEEMTEG